MELMRTWGIVDNFPSEPEGQCDSCMYIKNITASYPSTQLILF